MVRVYVAGGFTNKPLAREVQAAVRAAGHTVTFDWTANEVDGEPDLGESLEGRETLRQYSALDLGGVRAADKVLAVFRDPGYQYRGTFCEMGCAFGLGKPVVVLDLMGPRSAVRRNPFFWDELTVHVGSLADAVEAL